MTFISYAQNGEDVILWRALKDVENGFYIDVGACDPDELSVTKAFYERGWQGVNIEPVRQYYERCVAERPRDINLNTAVAARSGIVHFTTIKDTGLSTMVESVATEAGNKGWPVEAQDVPALSLADICNTLPPRPIHFLKIDVEGGERDVLEGADFTRFRPWIVVVEATVPLSSERNEHLWEDFLLRAGYQQIFFDGVNLYYVAQEHEALAARLAAPPNALDDFKPARLAQAEATIAAKQQEIDALRASIGELRQNHEASVAQMEREGQEHAAEIVRLQEELRQAQRRQEDSLQELRNQISRQASNRQHAADFVTRRLALAQRRIMDLEQQIRLQQTSLAEREHLLDRLQSQNESLHRENAALRNHRDNLLSSTSWRISAPLRKIKTALHVVRREPSLFVPLILGNIRRHRPGPVITQMPLAEEESSPVPPRLPLPVQGAEPGTPGYEALDRRDRFEAVVRRDIASRRLAGPVGS
ncbi:FkbM family methyltransferase [Roseomonas gilardii]|uniref:FkbM family methyltransferase n=1 Tax=Roseomonas gilardii TaxID=257708 RepID=UPI0011AA522C|nr:FkbM family methyltransferase [Roseomonas gilardii]